jgi:TonB family protein
MPQDASRPTAIADWSPTIEWVAKVNVACRVEADGRPSGCTVHDITGNPAFGEPALQYARSLVYQPGYSSGAGSVEPNRIVQIGFQAPGKWLSRDMHAGIAVMPAVEYPATINDRSTGDVRIACDIEIDGNTSNCVVLRLKGDSAFAEAALRAARKAHYTPAWQRGRAVTESHHIIDIVFSPPRDPFPNMPIVPTDVVFSKPAYSTKLRYPIEAIDQREGGNALVVCDLGLDGANHDCIVAGVHGNSAFGPAALAYVRSETIYATRGGAPIAVPHHPYEVRFMINHSQW